MISLFLKARHWQLFLLTFGIPFIVQIVMMISIFINISREVSQNGMPDSINVFRYTIVYFPILMILCVGTLFGWYWSVAIGMQKLIPGELRLNTGLFKVFLFIPLAYIIFFMWFMFNMVTTMAADPSDLSLPVIFAIIFPLHLFSMFCIFYCMYVVAKAFRTAELQRKVKFNDYAGEFFMIMFYPIGIWLIQPRINKLAESKNDMILV